MIPRLFAVLFMIVSLSQTAFAVEPDEVLFDKNLEFRARVISKQLRCVVCQNQDIDSSNAGVARDLRLLVRERLIFGDSDLQVLEFVTERYGEYVLLKPRLSLATAPLWAAPFLFALIAIFVGLKIIQRNRSRLLLDNFDDDTLPKNRGR